jgi:hypothetical protein
MHVQQLIAGPSSVAQVHAQTTTSSTHIMDDEQVFDPTKSEVVMVIHESKEDNAEKSLPSKRKVKKTMRY